MEPALVVAGGRAPQQRALRIGRSLHHRPQPGRQRPPSLPGDHPGGRHQLRGQSAVAPARCRWPRLRDAYLQRTGLPRRRSGGTGTGSCRRAQPLRGSGQQVARTGWNPA
ncbi:hypothetical protein G6F31_018210 [Rhizopus arrhizus]|nr:hypothetical protein G6F31_018210 [Rhizopus arrhizus]